jgi:hypothetical protein
MAQMRWSPKGARFMLKVRTAVMNTFERDHLAIGQSKIWYYRRGV